MRKSFTYIPLQLTIFLITGILLQRFFQLPIHFISIMLAVLCSLFLLVFLITKRKYYHSLLFPLLVYAVFTFIGALTYSFKKDTNKKSHYSNIVSFKKDSSQVYVLVIKDVLKPVNNYLKYNAEILEINKEKCQGSVLVYLKKDSLQKPLNTGDKLLANISFSEISPPLNPFDFNYKQYLANQQIYHQVWLQKDNFKKIPTTSISFLNKVAILRANVHEAYKRNGFKNNELAVISALLLGQRQEISTSLRQQYADAGVMHILAVSGLHIGIILMLLTYLFRPLHSIKYGHLIALAIIIVFIWLYAIFTGLSASVVRAVTMFTAVAVGMHLNQRTNIYHTLIVSMFFLLLFHPFYLFEVGFQLSYAAVFSIVWLQPKIISIWRPKNWIVYQFWQLFSVSLAAQIGVFPLSIYYFHQFPGLFFVANLVILPFLGIILSGGILISFLAYFDVLPLYVGLTYKYIIKILNHFVGMVAQQENFIFKEISFSLSLMLASFLFIFIIFKWVEKRSFSRLAFLLATVILIQTVFLVEKYNRNKAQEFIVFNKYKQSLIATRNGNTLHINDNEKENIPQQFIIGNDIETIVLNESNPNYFTFKNKQILVVDSLGLYQFNSIKPEIVILKESPDINLERLIQQIKPTQIVADASNYNYLIEMWKRTCKKYKTPFYDTSQKGAFILN